MERLFLNIKQLCGVRHEVKPLTGEALGELPCIEEAFLHIANGRIAGFGKMETLHTYCLHQKVSCDTIDLSGRLVLPAWCDSHTHIVFAGSRENEFVDKIKGLSYEEIAQRGGGILNSAAKVQAASENELFEIAKNRLETLMQLGTGAIEIKSGYGLTVEAELKMLRVIKRLKENAPIPVKATLLIHTYPLEYRQNHEGYIDLIINELLPKVEAEGLADYIDVFCETGFFSQSETVRILEAGKARGLTPKVHANQMHRSGGVQAAVATGALTADHLETMGQEEIDMLAASETIGTLLPTAAFFLRMHYQPARELINAGVKIALASDFNPGSSPAGNMNFVVALSCIQLKMTPEEAINAATLNGAFAMDLAHEVGSIAVGKRANLLITRPITSYSFLPYAFSHNLLHDVLINGKSVFTSF